MYLISKPFRNSLTFRSAKRIAYENAAKVPRNQGIFVRGASQMFFSNTRRAIWSTKLHGWDFVHRLCSSAPYIFWPSLDITNEGTERRYFYMYLHSKVPSKQGIEYFIDITTYEGMYLAYLLDWLLYLFTQISIFVHSKVRRYVFSLYLFYQMFIFVRICI